MAHIRNDMTRTVTSVEMEAVPQAWVDAHRRELPDAPLDDVLGAPGDALTRGQPDEFWAYSVRRYTNGHQKVSGTGLGHACVRLIGARRQRHPAAPLGRHSRPRPSTTQVQRWCAV